MKLIKIKEDHYIVVDDSEVRPGDYVYTSVANKVVRFTDPRHFSDDTYWKITHSTIAIEKDYSSSEEGGHGYFVYDKVKELSLQEVKELIGEVDVEALEKKYYQQLEQRRETAKNFTGQVAGRHPDMFGHNEVHNMVRGYLEGYNQALEDNKEKKYTEEDMRIAIRLATTSKYDHILEFYSEEEVLKSLQSKTEWEVECETIDNRQSCNCSCHNNPNMVHFVACCNDGWIGEITYKLKLK